MTAHQHNETTAGQLLVRCLENQGVDRIFCVPGESYLAVLDALADSTIDLVVAKQEGGAAMMAEADAKLTGRPGICFVTRGPGAANAASGVHVAQQDSTPLILFIGQVARDTLGRDAFQEVDFTHMFGGMAKLVLQIDDGDRVPELVRRAFSVAMNGRPGPVVVALPEDMLRDATTAIACERTEPVRTAPTRDDAMRVRDLLAAAKQPVLILGGSTWDAATRDLVTTFAESWQLPVAVSFRRQMLFDAEHAHYAGDLAIGANPALAKLIRGSDLVLLLGGRLSEIASQDYSLLQPGQQLIHVHAGAEELRRVYETTVAINASPRAFLQAVGDGSAREPGDRVAGAHASFLAWSEPGSAPDDIAPGTVWYSDVMRAVRAALPPDAIVCNGAGNYAGWVHRYLRFRNYGSQLAPTSGSMGYGLPAAVAAKLRHPDRTVVCFAGDGCLQMTLQEMGTARQHNAAIILVVVDNGSYGTIRMHQERRYPGRVIGTDILNPDFVGLARAYGFEAHAVADARQFATLFRQAMSASGPVMLHVATDLQQLAPTFRIDLS